MQHDCYRLSKFISNRLSCSDLEKWMNSRSITYCHPNSLINYRLEKIILFNLWYISGILRDGCGWNCQDPDLAKRGWERKKRLVPAGVWVLAAAMNTGLTWWGISVVIYNQLVHSLMIVDPMTYMTDIPIVGAIKVWVIRVLIIGSLVSSFDKSMKEAKSQKKTANSTSFGFRTDW